MEHALWMHRCLQLARLGASSAAPNPMVGAALVQGERLLSEGWHQRPGSAHAERDCLMRFGDGPVPADATLIVNLEPCAHHGRTPPCADLIIARGVKQVVIAHRDPFPEVNGEGVRRLRANGVEVIEGVLEREARWLNRRFLTSVTKQRPYIVLKWAQSADGYLDDHGRTARISDAATDVLVHRWRCEEQAILAGSRTVVNDDPRLDVRLVEGRSPLRVILDRKGITASASRVFDGSHPTLLLTAERRPDVRVEQQLMDEKLDALDQLLTELHGRAIRSLLVEGGAELLGHFISRGIWDEARIITGTARFGQGTAAPRLGASIGSHVMSGPDNIDLIVNLQEQHAPDSTWPW